MLKKQLTTEEKKLTFKALQEYITPNIANLKRKYPNMSFDINFQTGFLEVKYKKHFHRVYVLKKKMINYYKVFPYKTSYFLTQTNDDYSGFDMVVFAIWELYNPILQIKKYEPNE